MMKKVSQDKVVGVVVAEKGGLMIKPCSKRFTAPYVLSKSAMKGAVEGDVVLLETKGAVQVARILGNKSSPGILSLISLSEKGLSETFSNAAMKELDGMRVPELGNREDLRNIPLVTIDGEDSRDFDDAVFAEPTADGGHHMIVAIADVAHYVTPGSALDRDARARGNSTYFPDRVLPMLPEALSNGLCSLKPNEDRACLAFHLYIDKDGQLTDYKVVRGLMKSVARLTYKQIQAAKDGSPDATTTPLMNNVVTPLYDAYATLRKAREERGAMDLDLPEQKVSMAGEKIATVSSTARIDSQRLIEEFMVLANVAAATSLEAQNAACIYRTHSEPPSPERLQTLREYLGAFGLSLPEGEIHTGAAFKDVMAAALQMPEGPQIVQEILRVQAKAVYSTDNIGHFGLALEKYAHFTSPIRRYADLFVHRSLISAFNLGAGGLSQAESAKAAETAEHITETDDRSAKAARAANERMAAAYFADKLGEEIEGTISGMSKAGIFIRLGKSGTDALLPLRNLNDDFYVFDHKKRVLTGRNTKRTFAAGEKMVVRLVESDALSGSIVVEAANDNKNTNKQAQRKKPQGPRR